MLAGVDEEKKMPKWDWLIVKPGVLALSGTPFQVRMDSGSFTAYGQSFNRVFHTFDGDLLINSSFVLETAKLVAQLKAIELIEMGLVEMDDVNS
jgi:hypothetical protein